MTEITEKYLTLRGANNDIYFFQKRVIEKVAVIIGTSFVKTSLKTKDLTEAISSRDELVDALNQLENSDILDISDNLRSIFVIAHSFPLLFHCFSNAIYSFPCYAMMHHIVLYK